MVNTDIVKNVEHFEYFVQKYYFVAGGSVFFSVSLSESLIDSTCGGGFGAGSVSFSSESDHS